MSDNAHAHDEHAAHEGPVKTPKQLVLAVVFSFLVPIVGIILLVNFVASGTKSGAGSDGFSEEAVAARIRPVGTVELRDPSAPRVLKTGQEVYQAQCVACHGAGLAGAPKFGDAAAWAPRVAQGYETLLNSALKGKGAMGAQGGGEFSDLEIGRAVVYMVNNSGGNLPEPAAPAAAAAASQ
ncbi:MULTISPECIES: c-type cytochrome [Caldimonas]|jgi:cytochrome c5|uniref:c-type cytochrome n=1 Tax=Caldimonas TaxID=196013 RepID=UPI000374B038|nr:c-type cytochrome [Caldimonas manganoxidans]